VTIHLSRLPQMHTSWGARQDISIVDRLLSRSTPPVPPAVVLHIFGALAEFERSLMHERTMAGLAAARARSCGWLTTRAHRHPLAHALRMAADGTPAWEIATVLGVGESTVYRALRAEAVAASGPSGGDHGTATV
jgi:DNA invertase Pin-like site-specific DNA recombinase